MSVFRDPNDVSARLTAELVSFVQRQIRDAPPADRKDRRSEQRYFMLVPVLAQPLDEQFNPIGNRFACVTRDLSAKGIGLVHSEPFENNLLGLQLSIAGEVVNVVTRVLWCRAFGPFYYCGGEFVGRWAGPQSANG